MVVCWDRGGGAERLGSGGAKHELDARSAEARANPHEPRGAERGQSGEATSPSAVSQRRGGCVALLPAAGERVGAGF